MDSNNDLTILGNYMLPAYDRLKTLSESSDRSKLLARPGYFLLSAAFLVAGTIDTIKFIGLALKNRVSSFDESRFKNVIYHRVATDEFLSRLFCCLIRSVNPKAEFTCTEGERRPARRYNDPPQPIIYCGEGLISDYVTDTLREAAKGYRFSRNLFHRQFSSRLVYSVLAVSLSITRTVEGAIGLIAATLAILRLGKSESLNNLAYEGLKVTSLVTDLFFCMTKIINPNAVAII